MKEITSEFSLMCAPMQGLTEVAYRHIHASLFGNDAKYFTPFIRFEKGEVRRRDLNDWISPLNNGSEVTPQIIFKDADEFERILNLLISKGTERVDLNMGCPFPPQVKKGRGAGMLGQPEQLRLIADIIKNRNREISFSLKMRLGVSEPDGWMKIVDILNDMPLQHITIHPRTSVQQYSGDLHLNEFERLSEALDHKIIFNGEITKPEDISTLRDKYPELSGVMVGRGLIYRPTIFAEWLSGKDYSKDDLMDSAFILHRKLLDFYSETLCGDAQILSKIKPFTEYLSPYIERKHLKKLIKAHSLRDYRESL